ncbi:hypothetical protein BDZ94DRAFT_1327150 [Collybia nuda]|uniref:PAS domain-containing protein n=1 Tax=Collybia nuda TaxID=64659 RepID=A0A9P5XRF1_9AGAR|nr:hypothetical protein BDZ94DRAFT_1327150 [Collybia nuda]
MPFTRYLKEPQPPPFLHQPTDESGNDLDSNNNNGRFSHSVEFQLPQFIYSRTPTLAPGGGAEVLPYGSSWPLNAGFDNTSINLPSSSNFTPTPPPPRPPPKQLSPPIPPPLGLPIYSASGFDLLSILARVHSRPNPHITLGPVDLTCSFVVVDVRRHDSPIVYCSPSFCRLTGYAEHEVLGRNCRFLQAPGGNVPRAAQRTDTSASSVAHFKKALAADKECQASLMNYRKDGSAFLNLVSVIPIMGGLAGEAPDEVVFHVGFQVDLTEQPNIILQKLRDGTYAVEYNSIPSTASIGAAQLQLQQQQTQMSGKKASAVNAALIPTPKMSRTLEALLLSPHFLASLPLSTSTNVALPVPAQQNREATSHASGSGVGNHALSMILLNHAPDFVHVVSLKGTFLYVAPAVKRVLGYDPEELVGRSLADLAHPEDVVPLERELKESSAASYISAANPNEEGPSVNLNPNTISSSGGRLSSAPRTVDMLFRARTKGGRYVWLECRGRLHVEPGKGRKAIMLSGRARAMGRVTWADLGMSSRNTDTTLSDPSSTTTTTNPNVNTREFWGLVGGNGSLLAAGPGVEGVLGWAQEEVVGRRMGWFVDEFGLGAGGGGLDGAGLAVEAIFGELGVGPSASESERPRSASGTEKSDGGGKEAEKRVVRCWLRRKDGGRVKVEMRVLRPFVGGEPVVKEGGAEGDAALSQHHQKQQQSDEMGESSKSSTKAHENTTTGTGPLPKGVSPPLLMVRVRVLTKVEGESAIGEEGVFTPSAYVDPGYGFWGFGSETSSGGSSMRSASPGQYQQAQVQSQFQPHAQHPPPPPPPPPQTQTQPQTELQPQLPHSQSQQPQCQTQTRTQNQSKPQIAEPQAPVYDPTTNVFRELEVGRASSWQYELQQLRFANLRLVGEIEALEAGGAGVGSGSDGGGGQREGVQLVEGAGEGEEKDKERRLRRRRRSSVGTEDAAPMRPVQNLNLNLNLNQGSALVQTQTQVQSQGQMQSRGFAPSVFSSSTSTLADALKTPQSLSRSRSLVQMKGYAQGSGQDRNSPSVQGHGHVHGHGRGQAQEHQYREQKGVQPLLTHVPLQVPQSHSQQPPPPPPPPPSRPSSSLPKSHPHQLQQQLQQLQQRAQSQSQSQSQNQNQNQSRSQVAPLHMPAPRSTRRLAQAMLQLPSIYRAQTPLGLGAGAGRGYETPVLSVSRMGGSRVDMGETGLNNMGGIDVNMNMGMGMGMDRPVSVSMPQLQAHLHSHMQSLHPNPDSHSHSHSYSHQNSHPNSRSQSQGQGQGQGHAHTHSHSHPRMVDRPPSVPLFRMDGSLLEDGARPPPPVYAPHPRSGAPGMMGLPGLAMPVSISLEDQRRLMAMEAMDGPGLDSPRSNSGGSGGGGGVDVGVDLGMSMGVVDMGMGIGGEMDMGTDLGGMDLDLDMDMGIGMGMGSEMGGEMDMGTDLGGMDLDLDMDMGIGMGMGSEMGGEMDMGTDLGGMDLDMGMDVRGWGPPGLDNGHRGFPRGVKRGWGER